MAALQCEICGGKLVGKPGGVFECDSCGMEYSTEWAKQKIQEIRGTVKVEGTVEVTGKVQVEGGSVTLEGAATKESLLKRAKMCIEDEDFKKAYGLLEQVLNVDPECGEAYLYRHMANYRWRVEDFHQAYICNTNSLITQTPDVQKAFRYASGETAAFLEQCAQERELAIQADLKHREKKRPILAEKRKIAVLAGGRMVSSSYNVFGLRTDGTVCAAGNNDRGRCNVRTWRDIVTITCEEQHTVGLHADGTVVATGNNDQGQCNVSTWKNIAAVACGFYHTVGLHTDGTVVATGCNDHDQCDVGAWRDIVAVTCQSYRTVGLCGDGTLVTTPDNSALSAWRNVVAISDSGFGIFGLCQNGTVIAQGDNRHSQCNVSAWRNIAAIACGYYYTVGLRTDGTVVTTDKNLDVSDWKLFNGIDTLEEELRQAAENRAERNRREAEARAKRRASLDAEASTLQAELANLKGLFSGKRRREIEARLAAIETEQKGL